MKFSSRSFATTSSKLNVLNACTALVLSLGWHCATLAADAPGAQPTAGMPGTPYTVAESIPIDRLVQKLYANSPLTTVVLRKALTEANPKAITGNPQQRVKGGTSIVVPDHSEIARLVLTPIAAAAQEAQDNSPGARDYQARKQWVRFP
jgi:Tfp pilus assembly protein FimV